MDYWQGRVDAINAVITYMYDKQIEFDLTIKDLRTMAVGMYTEARVRVEMIGRDNAKEHGEEKNANQATS